MRVCIAFWVMTSQSLLRPSAQALQCLGVISGSGGCPGASISVVCAQGGFPLRPQWVPCCFIWCLGGTGCGVMSCFDACTAPWLGGRCLRLVQRFWAGVSYACVPLVISCSSF